MVEEKICLILDLLSAEYDKGCYPGRNSEGLNPEWEPDPFHVLIATILSQRTKDDNTRKASDNLFNVYNSIEELADKWFIDYGTANGWDWKTSFRYSIAYALHEIHKKKHPEEHEELPQREHWSGWHEDNCSCGFCSSRDSSD